MLSKRPCAGSVFQMRAGSSARTHPMRWPRCCRDVLSACCTCCAGLCTRRLPVSTVSVRDWPGREVRCHAQQVGCSQAAAAQSLRAEHSAETGAVPTGSEFSLYDTPDSCGPRRATLGGSNGCRPCLDMTHQTSDSSAGAERAAAAAVAAAAPPAPVLCIPPCETSATSGKSSSQNVQAAAGSTQDSLMKRAGCWVGGAVAAAVKETGLGLTPASPGAHVHLSKGPGLAPFRRGCASNCHSRPACA